MLIVVGVVAVVAAALGVAGVRSRTKPAGETRAPKHRGAPVGMVDVVPGRVAPARHEAGLRAVVRRLPGAGRSR